MNFHLPRNRFAIFNACLATGWLLFLALLFEFYLGRTKRVINPLSIPFWTLLLGLIFYLIFLYFLLERSVLLRRIERQVVLPIFAVAVAAEIFLQFSASAIGPVPDPYLQKHAPNLALEIRVPAEAKMPGVARDGRFSTDAEGFRTTTPVDYRHKPAGRRRVFLVGGSTTEQLFLDDHQTTGAILERLLDDRFRSAGLRFEVINTGKSGLRSSDHAYMAEHIIADLQPDYVAVLLGVNDLNTFLRSSGATEQDPAFYYGRRWSDIGYYLTRSEIIRRGYYGLALYRGIKADDVIDLTNPGYEEKRAVRRALPVRPVPAELKRTARYFNRNLDALAALASEAGIPMILMTQPHLYQADLSDDLDQLLSVTPGGKMDFRFSNAEMAEALERFNDAVRSLDGTGTVRVVDLAKLLPADTTVFYDDVHFNNAGAAEVAKLLFDVMIDL